MTHIAISVLVQTKNEEAGIFACLQHLDGFDEVIVVDSNSEDRTASIARSAGARVVPFTWDGKYPKKKQWQLQNIVTKNDLVLFLDADEHPNRELMAELRMIASNDGDEVSYDAYDIDLDYVFANRRLRFGHRVTKRCLVRKGRVAFPTIDDLDIPGMGELEGHYQPQLIGTSLSRRLKGRITHHDVDPVSTWFTRHNKYSDWEAHLRIRDGLRNDVRSRRTLKGRVFDIVPFKPVAFFLYSFVLRLGFLDGRAGFDYAVALSTYYWQIGLKIRELRGDQG